MRAKKLIFLVEDDTERGYNARTLGESIFVQDDTYDELKNNIRDAFKCHFGSKEDIPPVIRLHIIKEEILIYA